MFRKPQLKRVVIMKIHLASLGQGCSHEQVILAVRLVPMLLT